MSEEMTWRSIDSAPIETRILVWTDTDNPEDRRYISDVCEGVHSRCAQVGIKDGEDGEWDLSFIGQPTHWMPLPPPPSEVTP